MNNLQKVLLNYTEVQELYRNSVFRQTEIPVEYAVSLAMPTKKLGIPGYAYFASPALRVPGQPTQQDPPNRWWIVDAHGGQLLIFAQWKVMPFATDVNWTPVQLPPISATIDEMRQVLSDVESIMNKLIPDFFADEPGDPNTRNTLAQTLAEYLPKPLIPQYRTLAPDFFTWLEAEAF